MRKDTGRFSNPSVITCRIFFENTLGDIPIQSLEDIGQSGVISVLDVVLFAFNIPYEALQDMVLGIRKDPHESWDIASCGVASSIALPEGQGTGENVLVNKQHPGEFVAGQPSCAKWNMNLHRERAWLPGTHQNRKSGYEGARYGVSSLRIGL